MPEILKLGGASFHPSAANTGNEAATVLRGRNMLLRGSDGSYYFECFGGIKDLNEAVPMVQLTGTISYTDGSTAVTGTGTLFRNELRFGQKILVQDQVFVVEDIFSDTSLIVQRPADNTGVAQLAYKPPHLFEIDNRRGAMVWGNAIKFDRGHIIAVGEGQLRIDGDVLPGESLIASRTLQIALLDPTTDQYSVSGMGITAPSAAGVSVSVVAGGTRNMTQGAYSFRYAWANSETGYGFSNPSEVIKLDASSNQLAVTATNQRFQFDFTVALASKPDNADAVIIYRSLYVDAQQNLVQAGEGSWFAAATVKVEDFEAGDIVYVDVLDGELGSEVSFDNDLPPKADWLSVLAGDPVLISCYGDKVIGGDDLGEAPGPFIAPSRRGNREGYPAAISTSLSPPDEIIGFCPAVGRLFLMTKIGLPFAVPTGQSDFPVETRAFWQTRFKSPYGLVFLNDTLYAFQITGATRSIATGDKAEEQFNFAAAVEEITKDWYAGYVHAAYDPQNECVVFIYSAAERNAEGYWISLALPFSLRHNCWMPLIELTKPGQDMIVTGASAIGSHLQFLAGGLSTGFIEEPVEDGFFSFFANSAEILEDFPTTIVTNPMILNPTPDARWGVEGGDIWVALVATEDTDTPTVISPTGWAEAPDSPVIGAGMKLTVFWKRGTFDEAPLELPGSMYIRGMLMIYRGCVETGNPWDDTAAATGTGTTITFGALTTTETYTAPIHFTAFGTDYVSGSSGRSLHDWTNADIDGLAEHIELADSSVGIGNSTAIGKHFATAGVHPATTARKEDHVSLGNAWAAWCGALKRRATADDRPYSVWPSTFDRTPGGLGADFGFYPYYKIGDIVLMFTETLDQAVTAPAGFTVIPGTPVIDVGVARLSGFYRFIDGTEDVPPTFADTGQQILAVMGVVRGAVATGNPFNVTAAGTTGTGTSMTAPGVTTTVANTMVLNAFSSSRNSNSASVSGYTNADLTSITEQIDDFDSDIVDGGGVAASTGIRAAAGAVGATAATQATSEPWCGWTGAITPADTATPPTWVSTGASNPSYGQNEAALNTFTEMLAGDLMIAVVESPGTAATIINPTGWTEAPNSPVNNAGPTPTRLHIFYKRATGVRLLPIGYNNIGASPPAGFNHMTTGSLVVRGVDPNDPFEADTTTSSGALATSISLAGITTTRDNSYVIPVVGFVAPGTGSYNFATNWANADLPELMHLEDHQAFVSAFGSGGGIAFAGAMKTTAGAVGTTTGGSLNGSQYVGLVFALKKKP